MLVGVGLHKHTKKKHKLSESSLEETSARHELFTVHSSKVNVDSHFKLMCVGSDAAIFVASCL
jgi:hypothetical protein